jgi:outer membrane protein assembly factor BamD (BamD/ComL family)
MNMRSLITIASAVLLFACGTDAPVDEKAAKAAEMRGRIQRMEDSLFNSGLFEQRNAQALLDVYKAYATAMPLDSLAPEYLFRAAGVARSMKDPQQSIFLYDRIIRDYPSWKKLPDTYYLKAFVIDADLRKLGEAEMAYKALISAYPDHAYAAQARQAIENLKYTDEELIARFKAMADSSATAGQ